MRYYNSFVYLVDVFGIWFIQFNVNPVWLRSFVLWVISASGARTAPSSSAGSCNTARNSLRLTGVTEHSDLYKHWSNLGEHLLISPVDVVNLPFLSLTLWMGSLSCLVQISVVCPQIQSISVVFCTEPEHVQLIWCYVQMSAWWFLPELHQRSLFYKNFQGLSWFISLSRLLSFLL